jgi:hypothetical protein
MRDWTTVFIGCGILRNPAYFALLVSAVLIVPPSSLAAEKAGSGSAQERKLQLIVTNLKTRLSIQAPVVVSIVPTNTLMMSVEAPKERKNPFLLAIDAKFLETLTQEELEAAIAHELGHVWVFTHHPYLQTEELANQIAMRAVSRQSLERVYTKVWQRGGTKGDLVRFLGVPPSSASAAAGLASDQAR